MLKLIYGRYIDAGGSLDFGAFQHPLTGLVAITIVDGKPLITRWDESLDLMGVVRPSGKELANALNAGPSVEEARGFAVSLLSSCCAEEIMGGYVSDALGDEHTYPSDETAQRNMMGSLLEALIPGLPDGWTTPFWCADSEGMWAYRPHTAAQIIAAGRAGKAHVIACQSKLVTRTGQIMAAQSVAEVSSVIW